MNRRQSEQPIKYLSTFTGVGGFEMGIGEMGECVGFSEIDQYCNQVLKYRYPNIKNYGDITKIEAKDIPEFDMLVGGFPCQAFSVAGKRRGFDDTRGTLFFEVARIIKERQPRLILLENVKGLLNHDQGRTFGTILSTLDELGYYVEWQVLNAKNYGVPQNRERVFIIGHFRGKSRPKVFPIRGNEAKALIEITENVSDAQRIYHADGIAKTLKGLGGGLGAKTGLYMIQRGRGKNDGGRHDIAPTLTKNYYQQNNFVALTEARTEKAKEIRRKIKGKDYCPRREKMLVPRADGIGNCVTANQSREQLLWDGVEVRRLTPRECERLQGWHDDWTKYGIDEKGRQVEMSDNQRYKMTGNGVCSPVVKAIITKLLYG